MAKLTEIFQSARKFLFNLIFTCSYIFPAMKKLPVRFVYRALNPPGLLLRKWDTRDMDTLAKMHGDSRTMRYYRDTAENKKQVERMMASYDSLQKNKTAMGWAICLKKDPRVLVGICRLYAIDFSHAFCSVGFAIRREKWRKGIMTEALHAVVRFAFDELRLHRVEAQVHVYNRACIGLLEKAGFRREGRLRKNFYIRGRHYDSFMYGLIKK